MVSMAGQSLFALRLIRLRRRTRSATSEVFCLFYTNKQEHPVLLAQGSIVSLLMSLPDPRSESRACLIGQSRRKDMDSLVKPENDCFHFYALRSWRRVLNKLTLKRSRKNFLTTSAFFRVQYYIFVTN